MSDKKEKLNIHYAKSNDFTSNVANGVYGGIAINGTICMNFYIDRVPIPDSVQVQVQKDGKLIEEGYSGSGVVSVREVTSCSIMDYNTAKSFHDWLGNKLSELEKALKEQK
ncbi:hypothetical protein [Ekhidna sp.]|uniref:hypothetical protein n=1 Tax=Ekhidna sp. TaxID=2608089 RepID=UPI0032EF7B6D